MSKRLEEITAIAGQVKWRSDDEANPYLIMDGVLSNGDGQQSRIVLKGNMDGEHPQQHLSYRFYGAMKETEFRGEAQKEFKFSTFVIASPHNRAGVIAYLTNAPKIGRTLATRLWEKFAGDAVDILADKPDVAAAGCERLSVEAAMEASEWLKREAALRDCTIELVDLLEGRGFPKKTAKDAVKEFGNRAAQIIKANPYIVMRFRGCGFKRADALYLDLGLPPAKLKRQALCAWHCVAQQSEGHTWVYRGVIDQGLAGAIGGADVKVERAIELADRGGYLSLQRTNGVDGPPDWDGDCLYVAEAKKARNEARLAGYVCEALEDEALWPTFDDDPLSEHQSETLVAAIQGNPLAILGGSPGTGKTYCAAQIIKAVGEKFGYSQIAAAAPTGKAAVRLTEALNAYGIPLVARTIHSLLRVATTDGGGWTFEHTRANPLPFKVLVIDEASMIDTDLAASLFAARARGTLMLVIGDVNQLPPVGHGAPLRDMIAAGVPYGELREIRRNSGGIVQACADIRDGKPFQCEGNLELISAHSAAMQREAMLSVIDDTSKRFGVDPVWGVQVLCAVNKKSELSRKELNKILQGHLNVNAAVKGSPFRLADKVVCLKNGWYPLVEILGKKNGVIQPADNDDNLTLNADGKVYVANGELGECVRIEPGYFHMKLSAPKRLVVVPRGAADAVEDGDGGEGGEVDDKSTGTGCDWDLAYSLSTHKSQGSEFPVVIVMVDDSGAAKRVCSREWLYTAISRAKQCCVLVGKLGVAQGFCRRTAIDKRKTFLKERIVDGMSHER